MKLSICKLVSMARLVCLLCILGSGLWTSSVLAMTFNANSAKNSAQGSISDLPIIRVGVLQFGTINWEMDTIIHHQLDTQRGFRLAVHPFASKNASAVSLQSGAVDVIRTDMCWVSRQRGQGTAYVVIRKKKE